MTVEKYIAYLRSNGKNESVVQRIEKRLPDCIKFFVDKGIDKPREADYKALEDYLEDRGEKKSTRTELKHNTENFYSWRETQQTSTPVENETIEESNASTLETSLPDKAVDIEAEKVIDPVTETAMKENIEPVKPDEAQQTRPRGRKTYDSSGEKRTEKFTVYLTPTMSENVQDIARIKRKSVADYIASLIYEDCTREAERLEKFRELSNAE